jgi:DeoR/GlpR family transcriptional regulator of sugar metabolism
MSTRPAQEERRPALLSESRRRKAAERLREMGSITVAELEREFGISAMTARRDLSELERLGLARRTHGGAIAVSSSAYESDFSARVHAASDVKRKLARIAVPLVRPGGSVFLDGSSTSYYIAEELLSADIPVTVITNSLPVLQRLGESAGPGITVVACGGELRHRSQSFVGPDAVRTIKTHYVDLAFISSKGISPDDRLTDADALAAEVKHTMISHAEERVLVFDSTKLDTRGLTTICDLSELTTVITDDAVGFGSRHEFGGALLSTVPQHQLGDE